MFTKTEIMTACYSGHVYKQAHNALMYQVNKLHLETLGSILIHVSPVDGQKEGECIIHPEPPGRCHTCNAWAEKDANLASCVI